MLTTLIAGADDGDDPTKRRATPDKVFLRRMFRAQLRLVLCQPVLALCACRVSRAGCPLHGPAVAR